MDSVSQMALGASVGELVLGRRIGRAAPLWGAVLGTLPDLDVLIPYAGAVENFSYHRSFTHSVLVLSLVAPAIAWAIRLGSGNRGASFRQWWLMCWLVLITHPLLDGFTIYGTQLLWPLSDHPFSGSAIFIIDPLYTVPLLVALWWSVFRSGALAHRVNSVALAFSCGYLAWACFAKFHVEHLARASFAAQAIEHQQLSATPMPFNTIGWRIIAMQQEGYLEAYYSLLDDSTQLTADHYPSDKQLLAPIADHWPVTRLQWFTHGFYKVERVDNAIIITDIRMGLEGSYVFAFKVADIQAGETIARAGTTHPIPVDTARIPLIVRRVLGQQVSLAPGQ